jgi:hypothetical protein
MSAEEELARSVKTASDEYMVTRDELRDHLSSTSRDEFDEIVSMAEEFGAHYARSQLQKTPDEYGVEAELVASDERADELELKLSRYMEASYAMDDAVAELEQYRAEHGQPAERRTIAFHGELPVVHLVNMTVTIPERRAEPLVLREGTGPEPDEPERERSRGRGR